MRIVALGRKNFIFVHSEDAGKRARAALLARRLAYARRHQSRRVPADFVRPPHSEHGSGSAACD
jgi:hypothetical protein